MLDKEVVEQENAHVKELLSAAELQRAELELDLNKMRSEEIALRDALVKLQSLNEGLGMLISKISKICTCMVLNVMASNKRIRQAILCCLGKLC